MNMLWFKAALICYLCGTAFYLAYIPLQRQRLHEVGRAALGAGVLFHSVHFILNTIRLGYFPVVNFREGLSMFAWAVAAAYLLTQMKFNVRVLGSFVTPLCAVLMLWSWALPEPMIGIKPLYRSAWLAVHVATIFIGNGVFAVGCLAGVMYLLQERQIKRKQLGFFYRRLPSLSILDSINYYCIITGFPMLTLGMITGSIYSQVALGTYWRWDPKEVWSLLTWLLYAVLVHQRLTVGWRGRRAAILSIIGFVVIFFSFLGVNFILKGYHNFGTLGGIS